jgi:rubrerythrin
MLAGVVDQGSGDQVQPDPCLLTGSKPVGFIVEGIVQMQDLENALAVLGRAIHNEISGQRFYSDASFYCIDPWAKDVFAELAREEERHTYLLLAEYEALEKRGEWLDPDEAMLRGAEVDITDFTMPGDESAAELFPLQWSAGEVVDRRADDLAALAFGIRMEQQALALYKEEADKSTEPSAQKAYRLLIGEETKHYRQLRDQWERLAGMPFVGD